MQFQLLGSLRATADGIEAELGGHKQRVVLAALLLHPNEVVPIDRLIEWVWSGDPPRTAAHSIHIYVSELRKAFDAIGASGLITTRDPGYILQVPSGSIDIERFEHLLRSAEAHLETGAADQAAGEAEQAIRLWQGEALADFMYDEFAQEEIRLLAEQKLSAEVLFARAQLDTGNLARATDRLGRLTAAHPLHEELHRLLMESLYRQGRTAAALRLFQELRNRLGNELGVDPSQALFDLEERILLHDPTLRRPAESAAARNPFKGLRPFDESDAADFFGRTALIETVLGALSGGRRFLSLVGPSGSGKSSVTRAGVIPALREGEVEGSADWQIAVITPGARPFEALHSGLAGIGLAAPRVADFTSLLPILTSRPLLLVVDQFEELFTLVEDEWVRQSFLDVLIEALTWSASTFRIVITMRGDFYDRPLMYPGFGDHFAQSVVSIMPLTPAELGEAVAGPSQRVGTAAEPQLIAALVADVAGRSGALPLFQYSLTELFERKSADTLSLDDYRSFGGLDGALVGQAERAFGALTLPQQGAVRHIMLRLVQIGTDDTTALRRVAASEISSLPLDPLDLHAALEQFGALRLLSFDRTPAGTATVEIAHEALLSTWPRLAEWIESDRADLRRRATLQAAIDAWVEAGEDSDYLPGGTQLEELERWCAESGPVLTRLEQRFLDAARHRRFARQEEADQAADATRLLARRARRRLWGLIALLALVAGAAVLAIVLASDRSGPKVALIFDGRGGQSFGALEAAGWDRAARQHEFQGEEIIPLADSTGEFMSAARGGSDLIIGGGILYSDALTEAALAYPDTAFAIVDAVIELPNVTSYIFGTAEGSYLAGITAALASESGIVGFVGGMPISLIEDFRAGFEAGVLAADPSIEVLATYVGHDFQTAFTRPDLGRLSAELLLNEGADVIYHAAGTSGWGVLDAVVTRSVASGDHIWYIGVDTDQYLQADPVARPYILTSMLKRVDVAIERAVTGIVDGTLEPGVRVLTLADGGVGLAESGDNLARYTAALDDARRLLMSGAVEIPPPSGRVVHRSEGPPPGLEFRVSFNGSTAALDGPSVVADAAPALVRFDNTSALPTFVAFIPIIDDSIPFEEMVPAGEFVDAADAPDYLDLRHAQGAIYGPGDYSFRVDLVVGRWAVYCIVDDGTSNLSYLAGFFEVGSQ